MRLIDADVFKTKYDILITWVSHRAEKARLSEFVNDIQKQPTVKAIPVEWIVKRINYYSDLILTYPNEKELLYSQTELISLLEEWEKENEIDRS